MRQYGFILAFIVMLVVPLLVHAFRGESRVSEESSGLRLVIVTPHGQEIRNEFRWAFADWHQRKYGKPVELQFLTPGGTTDILRELNTVYSAIRKAHGGSLPPPDQMNVGIDMAWGGGDYTFNTQFKPLGILQPLNIDPRLMAEVFPQPAIAGVKLYDQDKDKAGKLLPPQWVGICLSSFGIIYNPDLYHSLGVAPPQTWSDLGDPRLFGSLSLADPTHSASAGAAYMMVIQRAMADAETEFLAHGGNKSSPEYQAALDAGWKRGLRQLILIGANARYFSDSSAQPPNDVAEGDAATGIAIDFYGRITEQTVGADRETYVAPRAATAITPDPIAVLYGTHGTQLELANHFIEFLLSPEGQRLWILKVGEPGGPREFALRRSPVRRDVYTDRGGWADNLNYFEMAGGFNQRGEWMGTFSELQQIWAAAWIDVQGDLRNAYVRVLAVDDPDRRAELLAELSDIPITRADVTKEIADLKRITADHSQDPDVFKASRRLYWSRRFAEHYQQVAMKAGT